MQKKPGFNQHQHCHVDEGMWMGNQSQEESYFYHEESWSSENDNRHRRLPAKHMNRLGASDLSMQKQHGMMGGMFQEGMHSDHGFGHGYAHHGGGRKFPYGGASGGGRFNSGGHHHEYFSEETEFEESYGAKVDEMRYQQNNWGGETCYANAYDRNQISNMNYKPHKVQWTAKGV